MYYLEDGGSHETTCVADASNRLGSWPFSADGPCRHRRSGSDLLGMVDREQPFHEGTIRVVHAGPCLRAWQQQAAGEHSDGRSASQYWRHQVRKRVDLYDTGWKQQEYLKSTGSEHWAPIGEQLKVLGFNASDVTKVVIGHAHWDHAGQLSDLPNAVLYVQREELRGIEWALNYPEPHIRAINSDPGGCNRTPACGYMPLTMEEVYGKVLKGKAVIVDGEMEILPGVRIHPVFRAHTAGSQLLEVPTTIGKLVFGSDAFSSYEAIRDWMVANVQQTDSVQQFLAYEKCYKITGGYENCVAAHEPLSYTDKYPITKNSWVALNGGRMAEIALAPGERSRKP